MISFQMVLHSSLSLNVAWLLPFGSSTLAPRNDPHVCLLYSWQRISLNCCMDDWGVNSSLETGGDVMYLWRLTAWRRECFLAGTKLKISHKSERDKSNSWKWNLSIAPNSTCPITCSILHYCRVKLRTSSSLSLSKQIIFYKPFPPESVPSRDNKQH